MVKKRNGIVGIIIVLILLAVLIGLFTFLLLRKDTTTFKPLTEVAFDETCKLWIDLWDVERNENGDISLKMGGWAIDQTKQGPFKKIYLAINGKATELTKQERPDVANVFSLDNPDMSYGYVGEILLGKAERIKNDNVKLIFVSEDRKTYCEKDIQYSNPTLARKEVKLDDICQYYVDLFEISEENEELIAHISGWAFDKINNMPFQNVYLRLNGKTIQLSKGDRADVVKAYKLENMNTAAYGYRDDVTIGKAGENKLDSAELLFIVDGANNYCVKPLEIPLS